VGKVALRAGALAVADVQHLGRVRRRQSVG
jgi:hypothetical protein